jgi:hypothetical protein
MHEAQSNSDCETLRGTNLAKGNPKMIHHCHRALAA